MKNSQFDSVRCANERFSMKKKPVAIWDNSGTFGNIINVTLCSEGESVKMSLNAGGLVEAIKRGMVSAVYLLDKADAQRLLEQLKYVDCKSMTAHEVFFMAHSITAMLPDEMWRATFDVMGTAMANSGVEKLKAADLEEFEAKTMCGSDLAIMVDDGKFALVKRGVEDRGLLEADAQQLEKVSVAAEQDPELAMALELLTADCSEEQEVLWRGGAFDEKFCTVIAKFYPEFAKFVDLGIEWNKPE